MHAEIEEQPVPLERTSCEGLALAARCFRVSFHLTKSAHRRKEETQQFFASHCFAASPITSHSVPLQRFLSLLRLRARSQRSERIFLCFGRATSDGDGLTKGCLSLLLLFLRIRSPENSNFRFLCRRIAPMTSIQLSPPTSRTVPSTPNSILASTSIAALFSLCE